VLAHAPHLVLFSGLGVGPDFMLPQRYLPGVRVTVPAWPEPQPWESLEHYAARMADLVRPAIRQGEPLFLGGMSFGAMVALEAARLLNPRALLLIAGGYGGRDVAWYFRWLARPIGYTPTPVVRVSLKLSPLVFPLLGVRRGAPRVLLRDILPNANPRMYAWGAWAVGRWTYLGTAPCPVHEIQGTADLLVPPRPAAGTTFVPGGGHVINLTHPRAVNRFLLERMATV